MPDLMQSRLLPTYSLTDRWCPWLITLTTCRQKRAEMKEYKKKKALKKKEKLEKVEQFREKEKERWQSFTHKVSFHFYKIDLSLFLPSVSLQSGKSRGGPLNSKQKKSIFAVPDSFSGRVSHSTSHPVIRIDHTPYPCRLV